MVGPIARRGGLRDRRARRSHLEPAPTPRPPDRAGRAGSAAIRPVPTETAVNAALCGTRPYRMTSETPFVADT